MDLEKRSCIGYFCINDCIQAFEGCSKGKILSFFFFVEAKIVLYAVSFVKKTQRKKSLMEDSASCFVKVFFIWRIYSFWEEICENKWCFLNETS